MKIRDLKYLLAYLVPLSCYFALEYLSFWSFSTLILSFVLIPVFEILTKPNPTNLDLKTEQQKKHNRFFDVLLYLNIPIVYFLIYKTIVVLMAGVGFVTAIGIILNLGIVFSSAGINVAHELGHREKWYNKLCAAVLLAPSFYGHFTIEHNYGHHKWVGTPKDPVTAKYNQSIYSFIVTAVTGVYTAAWKLSFTQLERKGLPRFHYTNELIWITCFQILLFSSYFYIGGWFILAALAGAAIIGFSLLECIDYVEHYGLQRKKLPTGRYERVTELHSWNSDHEIGRIFLYELTRHADHHANAKRKYQTLRHLNKSPELPYGYPASILMALVPPLWFREMNSRVKSFNSQ
jgi:alkane 1-monooxygenase